MSEWHEQILPFDQYSAKPAPQGDKYQGRLQASVEACSCSRPSASTSRAASSSEASAVSAESGSITPLGFDSAINNIRLSRSSSALVRQPSLTRPSSSSSR